MNSINKQIESIKNNILYNLFSTIINKIINIIIKTKWFMD